mmetsp:Transcript_11690/g.31742  ORF Transcript_11690/g.31742 Transcript_11690/m.31742 type:complete len:200 (-) Transcript_11690:1509-2108(-)
MSKCNITTGRRANIKRRMTPMAHRAASFGRQALVVHTLAGIVDSPIAKSKVVERPPRARAGATYNSKIMGIHTFGLNVWMNPARVMAAVKTSALRKAVMALSMQELMKAVAASNLTPREGVESSCFLPCLDPFQIPRKQATRQEATMTMAAGLPANRWNASWVVSGGREDITSKWECLMAKSRGVCENSSLTKATSEAR